jgi:hypothetical protein
MEIKPAGAGNSGFVQPAKVDGHTTKAGPSFASSLEQTGGPAGVFSSFSRSDLSDPAKTNAVVDRCLGELVDTALQQLHGGGQAVDKSFLVEFMASDPTIRGKLLSYLQKVLK